MKKMILSKDSVTSNNPYIHVLIKNSLIFSKELYKNGGHIHLLRRKS